MDYARLQEQMRVELGQRLQVLPADVAAWTAAPRVQNMGLSSTQRLALVDMMQALVLRQQEKLEALDKPLAAPEFADRHAAFLLEMAGGQELWRVFRFILAEHEDERLQASVRAAGRVAEDCYGTCVRRARAWGVLDSSQFREAPLVFLEAVDSPATASRREAVQAVSLAVREFRSLKLALPIVLLPLDYSGSIWNFCGLHHEVGHNVDQDLNLTPELRSVLPDLTLAGEEICWRRWSNEILADAVGVTLGGAGFAASLGSLSLLLASSAAQAEIQPTAVHPPFVVRVRLISEMLRLTGVAAHTELADEFSAIWAALPRPAWVAPFADDAKAIAALFLTTKLEALKAHTVLELNADPSMDHARTQALATFFLEQGPRPEPKIEFGMHPRLVPAAAQLAVRAVPSTPDVLARIHQAAVKYLNLIPALEALGPAGALTPTRRDYLRDLAHKVDFGALAQPEQGGS